MKAKARGRKHKRISLALVTKAIAALAEKNGSTKGTINKYLTSTYLLPAKHNAQVAKALKRGIRDGVVVHAKGRFRLGTKGIGKRKRRGRSRKRRSSSKRRTSKRRRSSKRKGRRGKKRRSRRKSRKSRAGKKRRRRRTARKGVRKVRRSRRRRRVSKRARK